jgi:S1-C subfamily serine protease
MVEWTLDETVARERTMTVENPQPTDPTIDSAPHLRPPNRRGGVGFKVGIAAASMLALVGITAAVSVVVNANNTTTATTAQIGAAPILGNTPPGRWGDGDGDAGLRQRSTGPRQGSLYPGNGPNSAGTPASTDAAANPASASESTGLVLIDTVLGYDSAAAAGTGMVLTSDGLVLTNNHVVNGATKITATDAATGKTYTATVVGTDATDDVAVLQLQGASGLTTVTTDSKGIPTVGEKITAVGNASGGGVLMAAPGVVAQTNASVTTSAEYTVKGETLGGMIEIDASVVGGDSGGAVLDKQGRVVGMTTAASVGRATTVGYAIPIDNALAIADQIRAGDQSAKVKIGYPAFLGVAIVRDSAVGPMPGLGSRGATTGAGAQLAYVYSGTPAASAGLVAGDTITAIDGVPVANASELSAAISVHKPGDSMSMTWTELSGATQSATVKLMQGPAA